MATVYPPLNIIKKYKTPPTKGELELLNFLINNLDSNYEIFFQPYLNGDRPDIIVFREKSGIIVFEVKDWDLDNYVVNSEGEWIVKTIAQKIKSPIEQVNTYKNNLITLHIEGLLLDALKNRNTWALASSCLYFSKSSQKELNVIIERISRCNDANKRKSVKYLSFLGYDSLNKYELNLLLSRTRLNKPGYLFKEHHANSLRRLLKPPIHDIEDGIEIVYTAEQAALIKSKIGQRQKIKGVAGCGKTFVLAKRAVNALKRTGEPVLIITYNLSLKNYIHDRINDVREKFSWNNFHIINYHQWFLAESLNYGLEFTLASWNDPNHFELVKTDIIKYQTILIDEAQDYRQSWLINIIKYFLGDNGELVVYGDEKQNIYQRELDSQKTPIIPTIVGAWNQSLKTAIRFGPEILELTKNFQDHFLSKKYFLDDANSNVSQQLLALDKVDIQYLFFHPEFGYDSAWIINSLIEKNEIVDSDVCILSSEIEYVREIEYQLRKKTKRSFMETTFENEEEYDIILKRNNLKREFIKEYNSLNKNERKNSIYYDKIQMMKRDLEQVRRHKKNYFWMKTGTVKLSTIHSFKGWDIPTTFLILPPNSDERDIELIYTGITRTRYRLYIIAEGEENLFHMFFMRYIQNVTKFVKSAN